MNKQKCLVCKRMMMNSINTYKGKSCHVKCLHLAEPILTLEKIVIAHSPCYKRICKHDSEMLCERCKKAYCKKHIDKHLCN